LLERSTDDPQRRRKKKEVGRKNMIPKGGMIRKE